MDQQLPTAVAKLLDEAMADGYRFGVAEARRIMDKWHTKIAAMDCESGHDGLEMVRRWRRDLDESHDAQDIARAALILLEAYAQGLLERGMRNVHPEHLPHT